MYYVYIVECADKSLYTGIAKNIENRVKEHNESNKGAKYTRNKRPVKLVYFAPYSSRSEASKEEFRIKKLDKAMKIRLINGH
jgi:putative endonuclease